MICGGGELRCLTNNSAELTLNPLTGTPTENNHSIEIMGWESVYRMQRTEEISFESLIQTAAALVQMVLYYDLLDEMTELRDEHIDFQLEFMEELEDLKDAQDLPMLRVKAGALGMPIPGTTVCDDAARYAGQSMGDGAGVAELAAHVATGACGGLPDGWGTHEGLLAGALGAAYGGGIMGNNSKRQQERVINAKISIVRTAHSGLKAVYNAQDVLAQYAQATSIYAGLTDLFIQGFNSAGAALGTALGKMGTGGDANGSAVQDASATANAGTANGGMAAGSVGTSGPGPGTGLGGR